MRMLTSKKKGLRACDRKCCDCLEGTANKSNCGYLCQVDIQKRLHVTFYSFKLFWRLKFFDKRVSIFLKCVALNPGTG